MQRSEDREKKLSRSQARIALKKIQFIVGLIYFLSSALGIYLLVSDQSLWKLAISHAYGLLVIVAIDIVLGISNLVSWKKIYLPSIAWAVLTVILQLGDIVTAPQYKMTMLYFAGYLFGLWAFDGLLAAQVLIVAVSLYGREYIRTLTKKRVTYFDMGVSNSRRDFLQIMSTIGVLIALASALGVAKVLTPPPPPPPPVPQGLPEGAVANVSNLQVGVPGYFQYPQGYPNVLFKRADGSLVAYSLLCTHVCCTCFYNAGAKLIECPCHGSVFDLEGRVLQGPAALPLPSVKLEIDSDGFVYPKSTIGSSPCFSG